MMAEFASQITAAIEAYGYVAIFVLMMMESTVIPIPSEVVMIPAGYLAFGGKLSATGAVIAGTLGSIAGATINYVVSRRYGRPFLQKHGKWLLVTPQRLSQMDDFFARYGEAGTFFGRLIPVVRHYISIPAGLSRMPLAKFWLFTALGAFIWMVVLVALGYTIGDNEAAIKERVHEFTAAALFAALVAAVYYLQKRRSRRKKL